jgi:hypothetical protein
MANTDRSPANGVQGSSYIYKIGTSPNTRAVVSQKVRILAPSYGSTSAELFQIGVMANFAPTESRTVEPVKSIGFGDMIAELVPNATDPMTANFERTLLYLSNLWQSTGYAGGVDGPVRSLRHHRWPFDVEQQVVFSRIADGDLNPSAPGTFTGSGFTGGVGAVSYPSATGGGGNPTGDGAHTVLITMYETCWFTSWNTTFSRDAGMMSESGDVIITDVHDFSSVYGEFLATGNDPTIGQTGSIRYGTALTGGGFGV